MTTTLFCAFLTSAFLSLICFSRIAAPLSSADGTTFEIPVEVILSAFQIMFCIFVPWLIISRHV